MSANSSAMYTLLAGVVSEGLSTIVLPGGCQIIRVSALVSVTVTPGGVKV